VLAGLLGRGGKRVTVIEKNMGPPAFSRPEVLWPATMEVLSSLASREVLEKEAVLPLQGLAVHHGRRRLLAMTPQVLEEARVRPSSTDPGQTREQLLRLGAFELRRGVEVIAVLKEADRVIGVRARDVASQKETEILAPLTVGDDGAHSLIREACGIEMKTRVFPLDFLCFGFEWPPSLPAATGRAWLNVDGLRSGLFALLALPFPGGRGAGVAAVRPRIFEKGSEPEAAWERFCRTDETIREVVRGRVFPGGFTRVRRPWGHSSRYGAAGAVLLGDAAHPVSPVGGQGANMSVADACALAEILLHAEPDVLGAYERRRRPSNERSLVFTRRAAFVLGLTGWPFFPRILAAALGWVDRRPELLRRFLQFASTAFT
jgi:2-polyprenyl-6-methoxyphenol hydroxylase-like FAD-dependent oxidoreductase